MLATAQLQASSMSGSKALTYCFVSTLKALSHSRPEVVALFCSDSCVPYPEYDSTANGGLSCKVGILCSRAAYAPCERMTERSKRLTVACIDGRARSK